MKKIIVLLSMCSVVIVSCVKDRGEVLTSGITTDAALFAYMNKQKCTYYKGDSTSNTATASISGFHKGNYVMKFNPTAQAALAGGTCPTSSVFPDSSLLVKVLYTNATSPTPSFYAVMFKNSKSAYAKNGWMWAIFNANGTVYNSASITQSGSQCSGCHTGGCDGVLTFL